MSTDQLYGQSPTICTHDGVFHCDEILGCYLLKILYPNAVIVRSRDPEVYEKCDIVLDVGNVYDPKRSRFDHHQRNFTHSMSTLSSDIKSPVKLSSAGLIYLHFGRSILKKLMNKDDEHALDYLYRQLYFNLIQEIDGVDNGIPPYSAEPLYNICSHLSTRVHRFNKPWLSAVDWDETTQFNKAMEIVEAEFKENVKIILEEVYPARAIVQRAIENRYNVHPSGEIIELKTHCPWKNHLYDLEIENKIEPKIKYVLFGGDDSYRVQCVSPTPKSYDCRKCLPKSWQGLRDDILSKKAGIEGCIFVHANGFIGGHSTKEGVLQMAAKSLQNVDETN